eukprot:5040528-Prymnesium_polylepis.1
MLAFLPYDTQSAIGGGCKHTAYTAFRSVRSRKRTSRTADRTLVSYQRYAYFEYIKRGHANYVSHVLTPVGVAKHRSPVQRVMMVCS